MRADVTDLLWQAMEEFVGPDDAVAPVVRELARRPGEWERVELVKEAGRLLTLTQDQAMRYGFAEAIIANETELARFLGVSPASVVRISPTWSEELAAWLSSAAVRGVLTFVLLMAGYFALQSHGFGLATGVAVAALVILLGAPFLTGLADIFDILLVVGGVILVVVEMFWIPGFGLLGAGGILLTVVGMILTFVGAEPGPGIIPELPVTQQALREGALATTLSMLAAAVCFYFLSRYFASIPGINKMILQSPSSRNSEFPIPDSEFPASEGAAENGELKPGEQGEVVTALRPVGRARFRGELYDVVTEGQRIHRGRSVRVIVVRGNRVVVEEV